MEIRSRLSRFFYTGYSEDSLALFRIYFGCVLLLYHLPQVLTVTMIDPLGPDFYYLDPIWYFGWLGIDRSVPLLSYVGFIVLLAATVSMTVGKYTRTSIVVILLCIFYLKGVRDSVTGDVHHRYVVLVQILLFLLLSRSGDARSLDARRKPSPPIEEWQASWPLKAAQVYLAFFYFFAIVAKIRVSGWAWFADGGRLQEQMITRSVRWGVSEEGEPLRNLLAFELAGSQTFVFWLCIALIIFEGMFPLVLFVRRFWLKLGFVLTAVIFHTANWVLLDVNFVLFSLILMVFFDLAVIRDKISGWSQRGSRVGVEPR